MSMRHGPESVIVSLMEVIRNGSDKTKRKIRIDDYCWHNYGYSFIIGIVWIAAYKMIAHSGAGIMMSAGEHG